MSLCDRHALSPALQQIPNLGKSLAKMFILRDRNINFKFSYLQFMLKKVGGTEGE